jgi:hypothetical protein
MTRLHILPSQPSVPQKVLIHRRAPSGGLGDRYKGGQFIPNDLWQAEKRKAESALPDLLSGFGDRLQFLRQVYVQNSELIKEGTTKVKLVPLSTIEWRMKAAVRETYARAFLLGKKAAGNLFSATPAEIKAVKKLRIEEFYWLRNFLKDMRDEGGVMSYEKRMDMYRAAAREIYNVGYVIGNQSPNRYLKWQTEVLRNVKESCPDCVRFSNMDWLSVADFIRDIISKGYICQSGKLACKGYLCGCGILEKFVGPETSGMQNQVE